MDQWYFAKDGQQEGPVTQLQIAALVKAGALDPATSLVWREGLPDWKTVAESGILPNVGAMTPAVAAPASDNPYVTTERTRNSLAETRDYVPLEYPGYGRLRYFLTSFVFMIICYSILAVIVFSMFRSSGGGGPGLTMMVLFLALIGGSIHIGLQRLKNLGMSGWSILWMMVPIMNLWIGWRMFACPAGYEDHRTLDTAAKVITGIWIGMIVLSFALNIFVAVSQA